MQVGWEEVAGRVDSLQFTLNQLLPTLSVGQFTKFTKPKPECQNQGTLYVAVIILSAGWYITLCLCSKSLSADLPVNISLIVKP